jgi:FMN phosphatase YigB (HAD superfamily)
MYVGDQYQVDCVGADRAGMKAILLDGCGYFEKIPNCPRIQSLAELTAYL